MKSGKQVRTTTRADRRDGAERDDDYMDVDGEDNFVAKMNEIVASTRKKGKSDFQAKKNAIFKRTREHAGQLSREILTSVYAALLRCFLRRLLVPLRDEARAMLDEITAERKREHNMDDLVFMLTRRDNAMDSLMEEFALMSAEVSPMRSTVINSASSTLQEQQDFYEESRRKIVRYAKEYVEAGIEQQRVATDASELIRHYNALLRVPSTSK